MKRIFAILLCCLLLASLAACAKKEADLTPTFLELADRYVSILMDGDAKAIEDMAPQEFWDLEGEYERRNEDGYWEDCTALEYYTWYATRCMETMDDRYGPEYEVIYEITGYDALSDRKMERIRDALEEHYDIDDDDVTAGYTVTVKYEVKGDEKEYDNRIKVTVVMIGGAFYWIEYDSDNEIPVTFPVCTIVD